MKKHAALLVLLLMPVLLTATPQEEFLMALRESRLQDAARFLRGGGDVDARMEQGMTPLVLMCREQRSGVVRWLLEQGADPEQPDADKQTPLMHAARSGDRNIVQILLLGGAEIDRQDPFGSTPLQIAVNSGRWELAEYLESRGARIREGYFEHPLLSEIWTRRQHYRDALTLPEKRWAAHGFLKAVRDGDYALTASLLREGSSPGAADTEGVTALMLAASLDAPFVGRLLLEEGADPLSVDEAGLSALWYASFTGARSLAEELLARDAALKGPFLENSPLFGAYAGRRHGMTAYLLSQGADFEQGGRRGSRLVHYAAFTGDMRTLTLLAGAGADLRAEDAQGQTALDYLMQGFNLSGEESLYLEPARFLKEKRVSYTIDPNTTGSVKLIKIVASVW